MGVSSTCSRVWCLVFGVWCLVFEGCAAGCRAQGTECRVQGARCRVQRVGCRSIGHLDGISIPRIYSLGVAFRGGEDLVREGGNVCRDRVARV